MINIERMKFRINRYTLFNQILKARHDSHLNFKSLNTQFIYYYYILSRIDWFSFIPNMVFTSYKLFNMTT